MAFGDCWEEYFSNKSFASELARSREASKHIDENLIFCPDGGFQVWTIEGSSEDGECGGGGIELKLTSCGRGQHLVDEQNSRRSTHSNKRNLTCCLFVMVCMFFVGFFLPRIFHL